MNLTKYCQVCGQFNMSENYTLRISDDKGYKDVSGHAGCIGKLESRFEKLNAENWNLKKTIAALDIEN